MRLAGEKGEGEEKCDRRLRDLYISGNKERQETGRPEGQRRASIWWEKTRVSNAAERLRNSKTKTHIPGTRKTFMTCERKG